MIQQSPLQRIDSAMTSYANIVAAPKVPKPTGTRNKINQPKVIFVTSQGDDKNNDEVEKLIKETIQPKKLGIKVKRVRKTARGVMIETEKEEQLKKIEECIELISKGLIIDKPKKKMAKIMIYDVTEIIRKMK